MKRILKLALFITISINSLSQNYFSETFKNQSGSVYFAKVQEAYQDLKISKQELLLKANNSDAEYRRYKTVSGQNGWISEHYQQYWKGYKIREATFVVHAQYTKVKYVNGRYINPTKLVFRWTINDYTMQQVINRFISSKKKSVSQAYIIGTEKVFSRNNLTLDTVYRCAYEVKTSDPMFSTVIIDAKNGEILDYEAHLCRINFPGTFETLYSGTQNIVADQVNPTFHRLRENRNGVNIVVRNMEGIDWQETNSAQDFIDNDNNWTAAEHGQNTDALDVHWAIENILDYWSMVHNRNSFNGNGAAVNCYVNVNFPFFIGNDNAIWDGSQDILMFANGEFIMGPVVSLDICSHEFGHGVAKYTAGFANNVSEASALNEGFSDIWGAAIEAWTAPNKQRWRIGEEVMLFAPDLRNLQDPNLSFTSSPDTYQGIFWDFNNEPHINSTVLSHWFFLLSEGGIGTNDLGNNFAVGGIGIDNASRIAYRTELLLNSSADYAMARTMSVQAAVELFGPNSCEVRAVENAWFAVGIGNPSTIQPVFTSNIVGPSSFCASEYFSVDAFPAGSTISWSSSNPSLVNIIGSGASNVNVYGSGSGTAILTATITPPGNSCYTQYNVTREVTVAPQFTGTE